MKLFLVLGGPVDAQAKEEPQTKVPLVMSAAPEASADGDANIFGMERGKHNTRSYP